MRARDAERSSPTGNGAAHTSVAPASNSASIWAVTLDSSPTIAASAGPADVPAGEDALVVGQDAVGRELLGRHGSGLGDVVVHRDGQARHDPRLGPAGLGRGLADAGRDVVFDGPGRGHPEDGAVRVLAGDPQQPRRQRRHQDRDLGAADEGGRARLARGSPRPAMLTCSPRRSGATIRTYSSVCRPGVS